MTILALILEIDFFFFSNYKMGSLDLFMYLVGFESDIFIFPPKKKKSLFPAQIS